MASKGQKFKKFTLETKMKILKEMEEEGKSSPYISEKYNVSANTIRQWKYKYKQDGGLDFKKRGCPKKEENINYKEKYEILKKFQDYLEEVDQEKK